MGEHRLDDGLAAIRGPGGIHADPKARTPFVETEAAEAQEPLEFEQMLAPRLRPAAVFAEQRRIGTDLPRDEGEHRRGRRLSWVQHAPGMAEDTKLDGETESVADTPPGADNGEIGGVEHVVPCHGGHVGRNRE
jgi:hypothetical protein